MKTSYPIDSDPSVFDKDSKKKYRESILKVFQARVHSPSQGGAILVKSPEGNSRKSLNRVSEVLPSKNKDADALSLGKIKTTEKNKRHKVSVKNKSLLEQCKCVENSETTGGSSSEASGMDSPDFNRPRKKKRKTRSERNKSKPTHVTRKTSSKESTTVVAKHVSNTQHLTDPVNASVDESDLAFSKITSNRLTKRLGLFNQGKKSKKIERDPIVVSSIQKKTNADIWKIIHDDEDNNNMEVDNISQSPESNSHVLTIPNLKSISGKSRSSVEQMKPKLVYKTPVSSHYSSHSVKYISSAASSSCQTVSSEESMPSSPPLQEISTFIMKALMNKSFIPKDLLKKTCDELHKLMKQSVPANATPMPFKLTDRAAQNHGSIQRSLLNSFMTERIEPKNSENSTQKREQPTENKIIDLTGNASTFNGKNTKCGIDTDVQMLSQSPSVSKETILVNAKSLLQYNDLIAINRHSAIDPVNTVDERFAMEVSSASQENKLSKQLMSTSQSSGFNSSLNTFSNQVNDIQNNRNFSLSSIQDHRLNLDSVINNATRPPIRSTPAVVTELQPHYMPQFHDGFYKDRLAREDSVWPNSYNGTNNRAPSKHQAGRLDILDLLDVEPSHQNSVFPSLICDTDTNDASWLLPSLRPSSPSPPHLFPHRLY